MRSRLPASPTAPASLSAGLLHGLKLAAVAIVAQAVAGMARSLCPDRPRAGVAVLALIVVTLAPGWAGQISAILIGGLAGVVFRAPAPDDGGEDLAIPISRRVGALCLAAFLLLLAAAFLAEGAGPTALAAAFYRSGALVFGGGHVVLPLLREAVVAPGWTTDATFLAGYGAAQALPGPVFAFAAYLGALASPASGRVVGAGLALAAIFLPGLLALVGVLRRSGGRCAPGPRRARRWRASMPGWSGFWPPRSTIPYGPARCTENPISRSRRRPLSRSSPAACRRCRSSSPAPHSGRSRPDRCNSRPRAFHSRLTTVIWRA